MISDDEKRAFLARAHERNKAALDRLGEGPSPARAEDLALQELRSALERIAPAVSLPREVPLGHPFKLVATFADGGFIAAESVAATVYDLGWTFVEQPETSIVDLPEGVRGVRVTCLIVGPPLTAGGVIA